MPVSKHDLVNLSPNWAKGWTNKEIQYLIDFYYQLGSEAVALKLGRTINAVRTRAYMLKKEKVLHKPKHTTRVYLNKIFSERKTETRVKILEKRNAESKST